MLIVPTGISKKRECQGYVASAREQCGNRPGAEIFPCQTFKLFLSMMLSTPLFSKSSFEIPYFRTCCGEVVLAKSPRESKESCVYFARLRVRWSVDCSGPKGRLCICSPTEHCGNLHLQTSVCLLNDGGFLVSSVLCFISLSLEPARVAHS